jgi:hypothetical protein
MMVNKKRGRTHSKEVVWLALCEDGCLCPRLFFCVTLSNLLCCVCIRMEMRLFAFLNTR